MRTCGRGDAPAPADVAAMTPWMHDGAMTTLCPAQRAALDSLASLARPGTVSVLRAEPGCGKTTIVRALRERLGGSIVEASAIQAAVATRHPLAIEEAVHELIDRALDESPVVLVDDADLVTMVTEGCHSYPRSGYFRIALTALASRTRESERTLVLAGSYVGPMLHGAGPTVAIEDFTADDYRAVSSAYLPAHSLAAIDFSKVHRFARRMTARQLRRAALAVRDRLEGAGDPTEVLIDYLRSAQLVSNVDLGEVQSVSLADLKGVDDVIRALEANVILPLEHGELAAELSLRPKRGVLLAGPPGTGKTTIGRALAHRLRGKFFLIDGTVIAGTPMFYQQLHGVFDAAMRNAPAVVFIDDSDVIFEGQDPGLYRYLLTMLDGLESESAGGVCLVLTAMDVGSLPPALVRSGRIELWLETRLPDAAARAAILHDRVRELPAAMGAVDVEALAAASEELSGADLRRVVDDGKLLYAFDRASGREPRAASAYFAEAIETVRANKLRYAQAEASARARSPSRPSYFHLPPMGDAMMSGSAEMHFVRMAMDELDPS
jgi:transitional endoplasmic reticulum ATPase